MTTFQKAIIALLALILIPTMVGVFTILSGDAKDAASYVLDAFIFTGVGLFFAGLFLDD